MKSAIAIAVLVVTAATGVLAQDNPSVGEPTNPTIPKEEQIRLGKVERLRAEQEWFGLEQMWVSMREQMRQQILQEIQAGVPPEQIQTEIQEQQQILDQEPAPEYNYVPVYAGPAAPVQTVFITPMDTEHERHERERWEREHLEHERHERERIEKYRVEWEQIRTQEMQRLREKHPELVTRIVAGIAKAQTPTAAPVVQRTSTSPTAKPPTSRPPTAPPPPPPRASVTPPKAPAPPPPKAPVPPPPPTKNKGTQS
jgi:hypothetical protein